MKKLGLIVLFLFPIALIYAQFPNIEWAKRIGGAGNDRANSISIDTEGNIILVGRFQSTTIKDEGILLVKNSEDNADVADIFIIKLDKDGKAIWAISAGSKGDDHATSCIIDGNNNIYITGWFESKLLTLGKITLTNKSTNGADMFIAKLSPAGECLWATNAGGEKSCGDYGTITLDKENNIIVSGIFDSVMDWGNNIRLSTTQRTMYVAKYNQAGKILWARNSIGGAEGQGVGTDSIGNIYVGGHFFSPSLRLGNILLENTGQGTNDAFVAKYSPNGKVLWAKGFGGKGVEIGTCKSDNRGNVYLCGISLSDSIKVGNSTLICSGSKGNIFIVKYDMNGRLQWAKRAGGPQGTGARKFYVSDKGDAFVTGSNFSDFTFGESVVKNPLGSEDIFILKYDPWGNEMWAMDFGGAGRNAGRDVSSDKNGNIFLTGSFDEQALHIHNITLSNAGSSDIFILKFSEKYH